VLHGVFDVTVKVRWRLEELD